uniref:Putative ovule protein n=1 Tax=Solanum chacoense TaxID=4108 RepID=A0A0V0IJY6_SOLCH
MEIKTGMKNLPAVIPMKNLLAVIRDAFINYFQQVNKSDGFDFDEYPGSSMYTPIRPLLKSDGLPKFDDEIKGYASMAIKYYFGDDV